MTGANMTMEEYLADLRLGCPLCGITEAKRHDKEQHSRSLQRRITRLRQRLEEIEEKPEQVYVLRSRAAEMCGECQMLMTGMSGPTDAPELLERIRRYISDLTQEISELQKAA
jgi:phage shock protein A